VVAAREAEQFAELQVDRDLVVTVPALEADITSLAEVLAVGRHLW
jgi:hypothetical protein